MCERTLSGAPSSPDSASKNAAMSLAIATRCATSTSVAHRLFTPARLRGYLRLPAALPGGGLGHLHHLHGGHLVLGAVGGPDRVVGGDEVGAGLREMERGVH